MISKKSLKKYWIFHIIINSEIKYIKIGIFTIIKVI